MQKHFVIYAGVACALLFVQLDAFAQTGNTNYGTDTLANITTGDNNSAFGVNALRYNTTGSDNTATSFSAL